MPQKTEATEKNCSLRRCVRRRGAFGQQLQVRWQDIPCLAAGKFCKMGFAYEGFSWTATGLAIIKREAMCKIWLS